MATISFYLKGPYLKNASNEFIKKDGFKQLDSIKFQTVYVRYKDGRNVDFSASLKIKTLIENWDDSNQRIRKKNKLPHLEHNKLISGLLKWFTDFDNNNVSNGFKPSYTDVKKHYNAYYTKGEHTKKLELFDFIDDFIERAKREPNPSTGKLVSKGTLTTYTVTKNFLKRYHDEVENIGFDSITLDWYYDFTEWSNSQNYTVNTLGKHLKTLKTFLNRAVELGLTKNLDFRSRRFIVVSEDADDIYLNSDELALMYHKDLSKFSKHDVVRDIFLIGCYTGLRISDFNRLRNDNINVTNGVRMITIKNQKTGKPVALPIHPVVEQILIKHDGIPKINVNNSTVNKLIKDVAEWCGIDERVIKSTTKGKFKVEESFLKHELVKSHTARRSFCTNAYLNGVDSLDIMALSGHTTEKSFKNYIKVTPEQMAIKMSKASFFTDAKVLKKVIS